MGPRRGDVQAVTSEQIEEVLQKLSAIQERLDSVEKLLAASQAENAELKSVNTELSKSILEKNSIINSLRQKQNNLEQYNRSWSIRIAGIQLQNEEASNPILVMRQVYDKALLPILKGAVDRGLLHSVPQCEQLLETAHILPARNDSKPKPVIARFYSRNMRNLMFQLKKDFAPKAGDPPPQTATSTAPQHKNPRLKYPFFEDLTKVNFQLLKALTDDQRTGAVWSINGVIKFKMANSTEVRKVSNVFDSVDDILK